MLNVQLSGHVEYIEVIFRIGKRVLPIVEPSAYSTGEHVKRKAFDPEQRVWIDRNLSIIILDFFGIIMDTLKSQVQQVLFKDALLLVAIQYTASVTGHTEVVTEQQSQCAFPHTALLIGKNY